MGESEAVVKAVKNNRNVANEETPSGTAFGELKDKGPDTNSLSGKDVNQSRSSWNIEDRIERAGHLDDVPEATDLRVEVFDNEKRVEVKSDEAGTSGCWRYSNISCNKSRIMCGYVDSTKQSFLSM